MENDILNNIGNVGMAITQLNEVSQCGLNTIADAFNNPENQSRVLVVGFEENTKNIERRLFGEDSK
ncbi:MAG: hypothetical protein ACTS9Y_00495 [Methylophilus sp.]|uniref:hypothetical protein n=1 Tax=Methylophilus sp. TaxID=29541 RepID=UPI003F9EDCEF